ncbi:MAG: M81 family metallopeptidase [Alphaproteobacteria bacterium]|nr:M81 family metallopeptidase [Alphaproteobacteria bacterium]
MTLRVAVGQLWQESHEFNPALTEAEDFAVERGATMIEANRGAGSTLGGLLRRLQAAGAALVPTLAARARPGGPVRRAVYEGFRDEILSAIRDAGPLDAVVFELHGAMSAEGYSCTEEDLMRAVRAAVGPDTVIAIGCDLHGHVTRGFLAVVDICTACKENPHSDTVEAGTRAADLALATCAGRIRPVTAMVKLPMLLPGGWETVDRPLADLHAMARRALAAAPGRLLDVSIFNVHPFRNAADMGQAILAIADGDAALAADTAGGIAAAMWSWRTRFADDFPDIDAALDLVAARSPRRLVALSDMGDRVLAGAPGDSTAVLARLRERRLGLRGVHPVTDPESAAAAVKAGVGAPIELALGGKITPGFAPLPVRGRVVHATTDGDFVQQGPYQAGQRSTLGPCAVVESEGQTILVTTAAGMTQDPAAFTSQGIDLAAHDFVVVKSGNHFKLSFAAIAEPLVVNTPGMSGHVTGFFDYSATRLWPEHELMLDEAPVRFFGRTAPAEEARVALTPRPYPPPAP